MPWEPEHNIRSLSPHGLKEAEGNAAHVDASAGTEMPAGLTSMTPRSADPHRDPRAPVHIAPSTARPMNDMPPGLLPQSGCLNANPHPPNPSASVKLPNTYMPVHKR